MKTRLTKVTSAILCCCLFSALTAELNGQEGSSQREQEKVDLKVGDTVADFTLSDQNGEEHKLSDLAKESKVAIVFHRSAGW